MKKIILVLSVLVLSLGLALFSFFVTAVEIFLVTIV